MKSMHIGKIKRNQIKKNLKKNDECQGGNPTKNK